MPPEVSVVMINRNDGDWLPSAIDSVLNQRHADFELVVVDDGSTDSSGDIVRSKAAEDPRLVPCIQSENIGISAARNRGIEAARGKFIALLDSDDLFLPDTLARYREGWKTLEKQAPGLCLMASDAWLIDERGRRFGRYFTPNYWGRAITEGPPMWQLPSTWYFPKAVPVRFHEPFRIVDAPIFTARMAAYGPVGVYCEPLMEYRLRAKSISNTSGALNLRIRNATALSVSQGRLDNPLSPDEVPEPSWSQVAAWTHGRNAKALAANNKWIAAAKESAIAAVANPASTFKKALSFAAQKLKR